MAGVAGGVGEAVGEPGLIGAIAEVDVEAVVVLPSHAVSRTAASAGRDTSRTNLRKRTLRTLSGRVEDTQAAFPWYN